MSGRDGIQRPGAFETAPGVLSELDAPDRAIQKRGSRQGARAVPGGRDGRRARARRAHDDERRASTGAISVQPFHPQ